MTTQTPTSGIKLNAVVAGGVAFIAVYALGLIAIVLVYSVIGASALQDALVLTLRIAAWPALAFPAWLAARVAGHSGWLYGLLCRPSTRGSESGVGPAVPDGCRDLSGMFDGAGNVANA